MGRLPEFGVTCMRAPSHALRATMGLSRYFLRPTQLRVITVGVVCALISAQLVSSLTQANIITFADCW